MAMMGYQMDITAMKETAERLNALPREEKANLALHLAGKYGGRLSKHTIDRLRALEADYPVDHTLVAGLVAAGVTL
jgi:hypothetical protein